MTRVIMAEIHIRDACDPSNPGDCAPVICVPGAEEIEDLVADFGVVFEDPGEGEDVLLETAHSSDEEVFEEKITCSYEPDVRWDDSDCRRKTGLDEEAILLIRDAVVALQRAGG